MARPAWPHPGVGRRTSGSGCRACRRDPCGGAGSAPAGPIGPDAPGHRRSPRISDRDPIVRESECPRFGPGCDASSSCPSGRPRRRPPLDAGGHRGIERGALVRTRGLAAGRRAVVALASSGRSSPNRAGLSRTAQQLIPPRNSGAIPETGPSLVGHTSASSSNCRLEPISSASSSGESPASGGSARM